jgi:hypothetical protein
MKINSAEISGKINGSKTLDRMHAKCVNISHWCQAHGINRRTFYKTVNGELGRRRDAHETRRIATLLDSEGLLVINDAGT